MDEIKCPVALKDIDRFERQNPGYSINVFGYTEDKFHVPQAMKKRTRDGRKEKHKLIFPLRIADTKKENHVDMLYLQNEAGESHYAWIRNMSRLLSKQLSKKKCSKHICARCLHACSSARVLKKHEERCSLLRPQLTVMPEQGTTLEFSKFSHRFPFPFKIYADCETIQENIDTAHPDTKRSSTTKCANLVPCSIGYVVVSTDPQYHARPRRFRGPDCITQFLDALSADIFDIKAILKNRLEMSLTDAEEATFKAASCCHICKEGERADDPWVRDHCHLSGRFRGAAHNSCNIRYGLCPDKIKIPVFFHNLRGFDSHLILRHVNPKRHGTIKCIPKNTEQLITFSIGCAEFKDTIAFLPSSLESLVEMLPADSMTMTRQFLEQMELLGAEAFDIEPVKRKWRKKSKKTTTGTKRKATSSTEATAGAGGRKRSKCTLIDDEAAVSGDDSEVEEAHGDDIDERGENVPDLIDDEEDEGIDDDGNDISMYHRERREESDVLDFVRAMHRQHRGRGNVDDIGAQEDVEADEGEQDEEEDDESEQPSTSSRATRVEGEEYAEDAESEREQDQQREGLERSTVAHREKRYKKIEELPDTDYRRNPFVAPQLTAAQSEAVSAKMALLTGLPVRVCRLLRTICRNGTSDTVRLHKHAEGRGD